MDRAEAIFDLEAMATNLTGEYASEQSDKRAEYIKRKIDALDMAIAALREQEQSKWISVEEKPMPENNNEYEVCCNYHGKKRIEIHKGWNIHCVTHWRPLPKPPKEGAEG